MNSSSRSREVMESVAREAEALGVGISFDRTRRHNVALVTVDGKRQKLIFGSTPYDRAAPILDGCTGQRDGAAREIETMMVMTPKLNKALTELREAAIEIEASPGVINPHTRADRKAKAQAAFHRRSLAVETLCDILIRSAPKQPSGTCPSNRGSKR